MSELIQIRTHTNIRFHLLATVSMLSLLTAAASQAKAEDADRPTVWIELGAQLDSLSAGDEAFAPSLLDARPSMFSPSQSFEHAPRRSFGANGAVSFQPENSSWVFSASVRYGRSNSNKHVHQQTYPDYYHAIHTSVFPQSKPPRAANFADTLIRNSESHTVLDFNVGKDVGLGLFGNAKGSSIFNLGVRYAQFSSRSNIAIRSIPDWHFGIQYFETYGYTYKFLDQPYHSNAASLLADRSFHGIGPSLSWKASAPVVGNSDHGELTFDWGLNGAVLFGRQRAQIEHQQTQRYYNGIIIPFDPYKKLITVYQHATPHTRSHSVAVPNLGGFAGLSMKYGAAKVSFGYRADFFFGAMDGGIDVRKTYDRNFHGPYATISIGLGG
ncbi:MAG TPA: hypothetical protein VMS78_15260 [Rhizomicrobium sp.]|nr:hypothetical protein [Rhizomicrobium sp.]